MKSNPHDRRMVAAVWYNANFRFIWVDIWTAGWIASLATTQQKGIIMAKTNWIILSAVFSLLVTVGFHSPSMASSTKAVAEINRISPDEAMKKVQSGEALLVCAYGDEQCNTMLFEGALLRSEFESKLDTLPKTREIIFYCS